MLLHPLPSCELTYQVLRFFDLRARAWAAAAVVLVAAYILPPQHALPQICSSTRPRRSPRVRDGRGGGRGSAARQTALAPRVRLRAHPSLHMCAPLRNSDPPSPASSGGLRVHLLPNFFQATEPPTLCLALSQPPIYRISQDAFSAAHGACNHVILLVK